MEILGELAAFQITTTRKLYFHSFSLCFLGSHCGFCLQALQVPCCYKINWHVGEMYSLSLIHAPHHMSKDSLLIWLLDRESLLISQAGRWQVGQGWAVEPWKTLVQWPWRLSGLCFIIAVTNRQEEECGRHITNPYWRINSSSHPGNIPFRQTCWLIVTKQTYFAFLPFMLVSLPLNSFKSHLSLWQKSRVPLPSTVDHSSTQDISLFLTQYL